MRRFLSFAIKAAVSGLLLYLALDFVNLAALRQRLNQIEPGWIAASLAVLAVQLALTSLRWQRIATACAVVLGRRQALLYTLIGIFFNQTLPSTVGGDAARIWLLARHAGRWKGAVYSVLIDRGAGLLWLALIVLACLPWSLQLIQNPVGRVALVVIGAGSVAGLLALFTIDRVGDRLKHWHLTRHLAEAASMAWHALASKHIGFYVGVVSVIVHLMTVFTTWCLAVAVHSSLGPAQALLLVPPVILVASVPISIAGWGVREGVMVAAFTYAGLPQDDGLLVSLLFGAASFVIGAIGGITWIASGAQIKPVPRDATTV